MDSWGTLARCPLVRLLRRAVTVRSRHRLTVAVVIAIEEEEIGVTGEGADPVRRTTRSNLGRDRGRRYTRLALLLLQLLLRVQPRPPLAREVECRVLHVCIPGVLIIR